VNKIDIDSRIHSFQPKGRIKTRKVGDNQQNVPSWKLEKEKISKEELAHDSTVSSAQVLLRR
jgi:hypothetical protein